MRTYQTFSDFSQHFYMLSNIFGFPRTCLDFPNVSIFQAFSDFPNICVGSQTEPQSGDPFVKETTQGQTRDMKVTVWCQTASARGPQTSMRAATERSRHSLPCEYDAMRGVVVPSSCHGCHTKARTPQR